MYIKGGRLMTNYIKEVKERVDKLPRVNRTLLIAIGYSNIPDKLEDRKELFYKWLLKGYKEVENE